MNDYTCPGHGDTTPRCPYAHCRNCGGCPAESAYGFGSFGHCGKCTSKATWMSDMDIERSESTPPQEEA